MSNRRSQDTDAASSFQDSSGSDPPLPGQITVVGGATVAGAGGTLDKITDKDTSSAPTDSYKGDSSGKKRDEPVETFKKEDSLDTEGPLLTAKKSKGDDLLIDIVDSKGDSPKVKPKEIEKVGSTKRTRNRKGSASLSVELQGKKKRGFGFGRKKKVDEGKDDVSSEGVSDDADPVVGSTSDKNTGGKKKGKIKLGLGGLVKKKGKGDVKTDGGSGGRGIIVDSRGAFEAVQALKNFIPVSDPTLYEDEEALLNAAYVGEQDDAILGGSPTLLDQGEVFDRKFGILPEFLSESYTWEDFASPSVQAKLNEIPIHERIKIMMHISALNAHVRKNLVAPPTVESQLLIIALLKGPDYLFSILVTQPIVKDRAWFVSLGLEACLSCIEKERKVSRDMDLLGSVGLAPDLLSHVGEKAEADASSTNNALKNKKLLGRGLTKKFSSIFGGSKSIFAVGSKSGFVEAKKKQEDFELLEEQTAARMSNKNFITTMLEMELLSQVLLLMKKFPRAIQVQRSGIAVANALMEEDPLWRDEALYFGLIELMMDIISSPILRNCEDFPWLMKEVTLAFAYLSAEDHIELFLQDEDAITGAYGGLGYPYAGIYGHYGSGIYGQGGLGTLAGLIEVEKMIGSTIEFGSQESQESTNEFGLITSVLESAAELLDPLNLKNVAHLPSGLPSGLTGGLPSGLLPGGVALPTGWGHNEKDESSQARRDLQENEEWKGESQENDADNSEIDSTKNIRGSNGGKNIRGSDVSFSIMPSVLTSLPSSMRKSYNKDRQSNSESYAGLMKSIKSVGSEADLTRTTSVRGGSKVGKSTKAGSDFTALASSSACAVPIVQEMIASDLSKSAASKSAALGATGGVGTAKGSAKSAAFGQAPDPWLETFSKLDKFWKATLEDMRDSSDSDCQSSDHDNSPTSSANVFESPMGSPLAAGRSTALVAGGSPGGVGAIGELQQPKTGRITTGNQNQGGQGQGQNQGGQQHYGATGETRVDLNDTSDSRVSTHPTAATGLIPQRSVLQSIAFEAEPSVPVFQTESTPIKRVVAQSVRKTRTEEVKIDGLGPKVNQGLPHVNRLLDSGSLLHDPGDSSAQSPAKADGKGNFFNKGAAVGKGKDSPMNVEGGKDNTTNFETNVVGQAYTVTRDSSILVEGGKTSYRNSQVGSRCNGTKAKKEKFSRDATLHFLGIVPASAVGLGRNVSYMTRLYEQQGDSGGRNVGISESIANRSFGVKSMNKQNSNEGGGRKVVGGIGGEGKGRFFKAVKHVAVKNKTTKIISRLLQKGTGGEEEDSGTASLSMKTGKRHRSINASHDKVPLCWKKLGYSQSSIPNLFRQLHHWSLPPGVPDLPDSTWPMVKNERESALFKQELGLEGDIETLGAGDLEAIARNQGLEVPDGFAPAFSSRETLVVGETAASRSQSAARISVSPLAIPTAVSNASIKPNARLIQQRNLQSMNLTGNRVTAIAVNNIAPLQTKILGDLTRQFSTIIEEDAFDDLGEMHKGQATNLAVSKPGKGGGLTGGSLGRSTVGGFARGTVVPDPELGTSKPDDALFGALQNRKSESGFKKKEEKRKEFEEEERKSAVHISDILRYLVCEIFLNIRFFRRLPGLFICASKLLVNLTYNAPAPAYLDLVLPCIFVWIRRYCRLCSYFSDDFETNIVGIRKLKRKLFAECVEEEVLIAFKQFLSKSKMKTVLLILTTGPASIPASMVKNLFCKYGFHTALINLRRFPILQHHIVQIANLLTHDKQKVEALRELMEPLGNLKPLDHGNTEYKNMHQHGQGTNSHYLQGISLRQFSYVNHNNYNSSSEKGGFPGPEKGSGLHGSEKGGFHHSSSSVFAGGYDPTEGYVTANSGSPVSQRGGEVTDNYLGNEELILPIMLDTKAVHIKKRDDRDALRRYRARQEKRRKKESPKNQAAVTSLRGSNRSMTAGTQSSFRSRRLESSQVLVKTEAGDSDDPDIRKSSEYDDQEVEDGVNRSGGKEGRNDSRNDSRSGKERKEGSGKDPSVKEVVGKEAAKDSLGGDGGKGGEGGKDSGKWVEGGKDGGNNKDGENSSPRVSSGKNSSEKTSKKSDSQKPTPDDDQSEKD